MRYTLMHRGFPAAELEIDMDTAVITAVNEVYAPKRLPVGIDFTDGNADKKALNFWWRQRTIPQNRQGYRSIQEALNTFSFPCLLTKSLALSLSDQYWINPADHPLIWENINFFDNPFSMDMGNLLFNDFPESIDAAHFDFRSPDITTSGRLKKRWESSHLFKGGSGPFYQEPLNEEIATDIMRRLNIPHVRYFTVWRRDLPYSVCENFIARDTELVSAWQIGKTMQQELGVSLRQHFLNCCEKLGIPGAKESIDKMLVLDYLIANEDRHWGNFGAVRNAVTLEWLGLAPVYDCGNSLWYNKYNTAIGTINPMRNKPFSGNHEEHIGQIADFSWLDISALGGLDNEVLRILLQSPYIDRPRRDALRGALHSRIETLEQHIQSRTAQYFVPDMELPIEDESEDLEP